MNATASLLADTICRTVELGVTITDAAVADELTHLFCSPVTLDPICAERGESQFARTARGNRYMGGLLSPIRCRRVQRP